VYREARRKRMHTRQGRMRGARTLGFAWPTCHVIAAPPDQNTSMHRGKFEQEKISHGFYPEPVEWVRGDRLWHSEQSEKFLSHSRQGKSKRINYFI